MAVAAPPPSSRRQSRVTAPPPLGRWRPKPGAGAAAAAAAAGSKRYRMPLSGSHSLSAVGWQAAAATAGESRRRWSSITHHPSPGTVAEHMARLSAESAKGGRAPSPGPWSKIQPLRKSQRTTARRGIVMGRNRRIHPLLWPCSTSQTLKTVLPAWRAHNVPPT
jgi:hypothetical protein